MQPGGRALPSSFIRTMTVGPGIGPGLLTFRPKHEASAESARGLARCPWETAPTAGGEFRPALKTLDCGGILALRAGSMPL